MKSIEQAGPGGAGTVTGACVFVAGEPTFEVVVGPALQRVLPWFRGGVDVTVVRGGDELTIMRGGSYRLLAVMTNRLDKMPPVQLRIPQLQFLRPVAQPAETLVFEVKATGLQLVLPAWARSPTPRSATADFFGHAMSGAVR